VRATAKPAPAERRRRRRSRRCSSRILILSLPDDVHAQCVQWALKSRDIACETWDQAAFPARDPLSVWIRQDAAYTSVDTAFRAPVTTVWSRRFSPLKIDDRVHPDDLEIATRECSRFINGVRFLLGPEAFWINPYVTEFYAGSKPLQLKLAANCGLCIPDTLMTNDLSAARDFVSNYARVIYKPFFPPHWRGTDGPLCTFTSIVDRQSLKTSGDLRHCPGIFQPAIEKAYEARVTMMGQTAVGAKISVHKHDEGVDDWRRAQIEPGGMRVEPLEVPEGVRERLLEVMSRLGIVFGCFDFIIDPDGRWVFLEVNPAGQFLWVENECPEIPMLEAFCNFLLHGAHDFQYEIHARLTGLNYAGVFGNPDFQRWRQQARAEPAADG